MRCTDEQRLVHPVAAALRFPGSVRRLTAAEARRRRPRSRSGGGGLHRRHRDVLLGLREAWRHPRCGRLHLDRFRPLRGQFWGAYRSTRHGHVPDRHGSRVPDPPVLGGLHERGRRFPTFLLLHGPFRVRHAGPGAIRQLPFLSRRWARGGPASYLLIGFWYERPAAVAAARQALVVNVIGDWGMMVALFILFLHFHTLQYVPIFKHVPAVLGYDGSTVRIVTLLLLVGAVAKSAQLPLHVWLPNAMEGPTPVSALIHAATMVTAGVYLIARSYPLFHSAPFTQSVVIIIGTCGAFFAATCALANNDIKRVLAYSTMSQIAYMFVGVGAASYASGIFHLTTHAYFKACLFMGAGAVMHALHDNVDIRRMGGLKATMPVTFWCFLIATMAISGVPLFSGFFSKDEIIGNIYFLASHTGWYWAIWILLSVTAGLTALYMFRLLFMVFLGQERDPELALHAHDPPLVMRLPMMILAVLAVIGGYLAFPGAPNWIGNWLRHSFERFSPVAPAEPATQWASVIIVILTVALGIFAAYRIYYQRRPAPEQVGATAPAIYRLFLNRWYVDGLYDRAVVRPIIVLGLFLSTVVERFVINGLVEGSAAALRDSSRDMRRVQSGYVRNYALSILLGAVLVVGYYVFRR